MSTSKTDLYQVIKKRYTLMGILITVLTLLIYTVLAYSSLEQLIYQNLCAVRDEQINLIKVWIDERANDIKNVSLNPVLQGNDLDAIRAAFKNCIYKKSNNFQSILFINKEGKVLIDGEEEKPNFTVADRDYFKLALKGKSCISEVIKSRETGEYIVVVSNPIISAKGEIAGVVAGTLNMNRINEIFSYFHMGKTGTTYLVDKKGFMVTDVSYTPWLFQKGMMASEVIERLSQNESGYFDYKNHLGSRVFGAYKDIDRYNWSLVVEIEQSEVIRPFMEKVGLIVLAFLFLYIVLIYPLTKRTAAKIAEPIGNLVKNTELYLQNNKNEFVDPVAAEKLPYKEIEVLNNTLYNLVEKVASLESTLKSQELYDPLTGVSNRRNFFLRGQEIIELARRKKNPFSMIYFDIDHFKNINENFGNQAGDKVLVILSNMMGETIRISDVVGRLAGEEFAIILPETDIKGAEMFAERFRKHVASTPIVVDYHTFNITISIGAASYPDCSEETKSSLELLESLMNQADKALQRAKEKGGNRVEIYSA